MDKNDYPVITISGAEWQAAQNAAESAQHSLQQLKAEIAARVDRFCNCSPVNLPNEIDSLVRDLRQLSAV
jgi:hypothetical protein